MWCFPRLVAALLLVLPGCNGTSSENKRSPDGRELLERSAAALEAVQTVEYDFVFGHREDVAGHVTGHTVMKRAGDAKDGWIRVVGHVREQPQFQRPAQRFDYGLDAEYARLVNVTEGTYAEARRGAGSNVLASNAVYGYLTEFIETRPLWKELSSAKTVEVLAPETVDGVTCDVVRTTYDVQGRIVEVTWSIARTDRLPRRGRWTNSSYAPGTMTFTMTNLRTNRKLEAGHFLPARSPALKPAAETAQRPVALGEVVPAWELLTSDGRPIGSQTLRGKIVVLDFWNTWCFICRAIAPQTRALEREMPADVQFVGVNIFETGEAASYWKESGAPYPTVLGGEQLAAMLDVSGQPAVAVIDAEGRLRYAEVGATADRPAHIRKAIESSRR